MTTEVLINKLGKKVGKVRVIVETLDGRFYDIDNVIDRSTSEVIILLGKEME